MFVICESLSNKNNKSNIKGCLAAAFFVIGDGKLTIEHKDITEANLHEPKGASIALAGQAYIADGSGSGDWRSVLANPDNLIIERVLEAYSTDLYQAPTGLDTPHQIKFGPAVNSPADKAMVDTSGKVTINEAGTYRLRVNVGVGRSGGSGTSELFLRVKVNGSQAGRSVHFRVGAADVYYPFSDESWLNLAENTEITYEILRDSSGDNSGGLLKGVATPVDWEDSPCSYIKIEKWSS